MRIRRFSAPGLQAALRQVKAVLGPEAVILETTEAGGMVTVTAGMDEEDGPGGHDLAREVRELVGLVGELLHERQPDGAADLRPELRALHRTLAGQGVDGVVAAALVRETAALVGRGRSLDAALAAVLGAPVPARPEARVRLFVGPPGDGKTTTIAKLAAQERHAGRRVALIGADTYRLGAAAELDAFGRALGVPVTQVGTPAELAAAVLLHRDRDRVLVDTAGACAGQTHALAELRGLVEAAGAEAGCTLVASASTAYPTASQICLAYGVLAPDACVLTKLDAAPAGAWLGLLWRQGLGISHLAAGRRVPDDLEPATPERLARCLLAA
jgi:flagellar biosynthesis protein FlhF